MSGACSDPARALELLLASVNAKEDGAELCAPSIAAVAFARHVLGLPNYAYRHAPDYKRPPP